MWKTSRLAVLVGEGPERQPEDPLQTEAQDNGGDESRKARMTYSSNPSSPVRATIDFAPHVDFKLS